MNIYLRIFYVGECNIYLKEVCASHHHRRTPPPLHTIFPSISEMFNSLQNGGAKIELSECWKKDIRLLALITAADLFLNCILSEGNNGESLFDVRLLTNTVKEKNQ